MWVTQCLKTIYITINKLERNTVESERERLQLEKDTLSDGEKQNVWFLPVKCNKPGSEFSSILHIPELSCVTFVNFGIVEGRWIGRDRVCIAEEFLRDITIPVSSMLTIYIQYSLNIFHSFQTLILYLNFSNYRQFFNFRIHGLLLIEVFFHTFTSYFRLFYK